MSEINNHNDLPDIYDLYPAAEEVSTEEVAAQVIDIENPEIIRAGELILLA